MIPLADVAASNASVANELHAALSETIKRGDFILGKAVSTFESEFASYIGRKHCVGDASGTSALELLFKAMKFGPGDEVIIQSNSYIATTFALSATGCTLVVVDCDATGALDVSKVEEKITERTKAIVVVHLFGNMPDMERLCAIAAEHKNIPIVEDCAQAHGATFNGTKAGKWGYASCFSFYPGKNLGCLGDGGAVLTDDDDLARQLRLLGNLGKSSKYSHDIMGTNSRLDTLQAAFLSVKLPHLEEWNEARRALAAKYDELLCQAPFAARVAPVQVTKGCVSARHLYVVCAESKELRDKIVEYLNGHDVQCLIHYPVPFHQSRAYIYDGGNSTLSMRVRDVENSTNMADKMFSLPLFPELSDNQQRVVIASLQDVFQF